MTDDPIERQRQHFNSIAEKYEAARRHPNHLLLKELIWAEILDSKLNRFGTSIKVLEPMCGYADGYKIIADRTEKEIQYSGFDYSDEVVNRLKQLRPDLKTWVQDISKFETSENFDVIILLGGLHHVPHIADDAVNQLAYHLNPGGLFINFEPTHGNSLVKYIRDKIYRKNDLFDEETERAFSVSELLGFFESANLKQVDTIWPGMLAYILYYNPDAFPALNFGSTGMVSSIWSIEKRFLRTVVARTLSFACLTVWEKN